MTHPLDTLFRADCEVSAGKGTAVDERTGTEALLAAAAGGDPQAWDLLVARYARLVWSIARSLRLPEADAADVCQTTWLRLVEHLGSIKDPDRLAGWLATTTRRESFAVLNKRNREVPIFDDSAEDDGDSDQDPESQTIAQDEYRELWNAFAGLSEKCRALLRVLTVTPMESYAEIAVALKMPVGSIGPTRARCLDQLRARLAV